MAFATAAYACVSGARPAAATPFAGVAAEHRAYQAVGLSFGRIFDLTGAPAATGFGAVSNAVFGLDSELPVAPLAGVRLAARAASASVQQRLAGRRLPGIAPFRFDGPATTFSFWRNAFFPRFFGVANALALSRISDRAVATPTAETETTTFIYPVSDAPVASGPRFFSPSTPSAPELTASPSSPLPLGGPTLDSSFAQHLQRQASNGFTQRSFSSAPSSAVRLQWDKLGGRVSFPVAVLGKHVSVNLNADLEHLYRHDATASPYLPLDAGAQPASQALPDPAVRYFPNYVDVVHSTLTAGASLPLTRDVVLSARYDTQVYRGSYGAAIGQSVTERKDQYQGTVTYTIPKTANSVSVLFRNQQYHDAVLPTYNVNANREDLNFTVRF